MKKKIIIVMKSLPSGGIERALITAFGFMPSERYDVTLVLLSNVGYLLSEVPTHVHIVEYPFTPIQRIHYGQGRRPVLKYAALHGHWFYALCILSHRFFWNIGGRKSSRDFRDQLTMLSGAYTFNDNFDLAISYAGGVVCSQIVLDHIRAIRKVVWFHGEGSAAFEKKDVYDKIYARFDRRYTCSKTLAMNLSRIYDVDESAFTPFPHAIDVVTYKSMAQQGGGFDDGFTGLRILSVGRLHEQKGFDIAIRVAAKLKHEGLAFRWYVVGEGGDRSSLEQLIQEHGVSDAFVLLGQTHNPYPYFNTCDIYAQPSRYEGYCLTLAEARAFNKPIVTTDFVGAREQLQSDVTGIIVPPNDEVALYEAVKRVLSNSGLRQCLSQALTQQSADTMSEVRNAWKELLP